MSNHRFTISILGLIIFGLMLTACADNPASVPCIPESNPGLTDECVATPEVGATASVESTSVPVEPTAPPNVSIAPGDDLQQAIDSNPEGTTFEIEFGTHRLVEVVPKNGNSFIGQTGAILNGSKQLTEFTREGRFWVADAGLTSQGTIQGECGSPGYEGCRFPQDVFIDDRMLGQVTDLGQVAPGSWYLDFDANKVYLWEDPGNRIVELSVAAIAFLGTADNVTIRGLIIEKYATPAQRGAIHARNEDDGTLGANWVVEQNEIRLNHGAGIRLGAAMQVLYNNIHHNGQIGIVGGESKDILIEGNEIAFNNTAGFSGYWEAGGTKFVHTEDLVVRGNYVHDNVGPGLWTDIDNINTLYEDNNVEGNLLIGIQHEISYSAVIRNNLVRNNGPAIYDYLWGAQIMISASSDVEVYGNTVVSPLGGQGIAVIQDSRADYPTRNVYVHHNNIAGPGKSGADENPADPEMYDSVLFDHNNYYGADKWFWDEEVSFEEFQAEGQELNGTSQDIGRIDSTRASP